MKNIRTYGKELKAQLDNEMINLMTGNIKAPTKGDKAAITLGAVIGTVGYLAVPAFAQPKEEGLFDTVKTALSTYYTQFLGITTGLAIFLILIAILWGMLSPSGRGSETAFGWAKKIALCWIVINCLGGILKIGQDLTSSQRLSDLSSVYNTQS